MSLRFFIVLISFSLFSLKAFAGLMELSYSMSLTDSTVDTNNYTKTVRNTASFAWYFMEMSALEVSYSKGEQQISVAAESETPQRYRSEFQMYGADLVFSFAGKDSAFQPYIKGGAAWVEKKLYRRQSLVAPEELISQTDGSTAVPSMGVGFKLMLFKNIRLKASYDRWRSNKDNDGETWDNTVGAGISVFL